MTHSTVFFNRLGQNVWKLAAILVDMFVGLTNLQGNKESSCSVLTDGSNDCQDHHEQRSVNRIFSFSEPSHVKARERHRREEGRG